MNVQGDLFQMETVGKGEEKGEFHERVNRTQCIICIQENSATKPINNSKRQGGRGDGKKE
jgi:hypothetical protein